MTFLAILIQYCKFIMQRPLKRGILGASTIILSKGIDKYAFLCGLNLYETVVTKHFNTSFHSEFHSESHSEFMRQNVKIVMWYQTGQQLNKMHQCVLAALPMAWPSPVYTNELLKFLWWLVKTTALLVAHFLTGFSLTAIIYEKTTPLTAYLCTKVWRILTLHWSKNSHYIANQSCS